jgi:hypothetical protein
MTGAANSQTAKRIFRDAPFNDRCMATVTLKDKSLAQCGRYRTHGILCTQHHKIKERK